MFIGSEGSLGVITAATLKISPLPHERANVALLFEHMADGVKACRTLAQSDLGPTVVRLYDREDTTLFTRNEPQPLEGNLLLLSFDGDSASARADAARSEVGGSDAEERLVEHWWQHRNDAVGEFRNLMRGEGLLGPHAAVDTMEVTGTWSVLRDLYHSMKEALTKEADFAACHLSHIYPDGACLYFTLGSACDNDEEALAVNERWWDIGMTHLSRSRWVDQPPPRHRPSQGALVAGRTGSLARRFEGLKEDSRSQRDHEPRSARALSSSFGPITIICNRQSGRGGVAKALPEVTKHLNERELEHEFVYTQYGGHATDIAREAVKNGSRFLAAMGGDGTVHEVVNGMIESDKAINPEAVFGVVAAGTGSDFIKTFGIPATPSHAVAHLDGPESFPIDIGKITYEGDTGEEVRYFANIAEAGFGANTVERAARLPRWFGPTVYFFAFWLNMRKHRIARVKVDLVDREYEGYMNNLVVANGQFFGGGMKVAPKAAPTDGVLDVQIEHARKREALALIPKIYKGEHVPHPDIEEFKRVKLSIEADRPLLIEADGEVLGHTPATFEVLKDLLRLKV